jgi:hypothetical protein
MTSRRQQLIAAFTRSPDDADIEIGQSVMWTGLLASGLTSGLLLIVALAKGVPLASIALYAAAVLLYLGLLVLIDIPSPIARWLWRHMWVFLLAIGLVALAIQAMAGEAFLQPIIFLVPLIYAALAYPAARVAAVGLFYLGLMNLGI